MTENEISFIIRGAIFKVYNTLGPGLLESVYVAALTFELRKAGLEVQNEVPVSVSYETEKLDIGFRMDMLVEKKVNIEVKSIQNISEVHHKISLTYLRLTGLKLGIVVNFCTDNISKSIFRKVNKL
ncbi:MAG: GxxExxY protein [Ignavibacteria bacterium]|nr:GxxExxY protein [Ignavibacteria bacterium]